jgi:hypothetical protein
MYDVGMVADIQSLVQISRLRLTTTLNREERISVYIRLRIAYRIRGSTTRQSARCSIITPLSRMLYVPVFRDSLVLVVGLTEIRHSCQSRKIILQQPISQINGDM